MTGSTSNITGIIVSYNTKKLLQNCINSIRKYYPSLKLIVVDGSEKTNPCYGFSKSLNDDFTVVKNVEYNIGHGNGMKLGISLCKTEYFTLIDSDTILLKHGIFEEMLKTINFLPNYGIGKIVYTNKYGGNVPKNEGLMYLHPYFCLINKQEYFNFKPIIHHGAPMIDCMLDLYNSGLFFEKLIYFEKIDDYVLHLGRGTRVLNPKEFLPSGWDKQSIPYTGPK